MQVYISSRGGTYHTWKFAKHKLYELTLTGHIRTIFPKTPRQGNDKGANIKAYIIGIQEVLQTNSGTLVTPRAILQFSVVSHRQDISTCNDFLWNYAAYLEVPWIL